MERMTFTCKIEPGEYRRAAWIHIRPRPTFAIVGITLVVLCLFVVLFALYKFLVTGQGLAAVLGVGASLAYFGVYFFILLPRRVDRLYGQQKLLHNEFTFDVSDENLVSRSILGESKFDWSMFHKWKSGEDIVLLYQSDVLFHVFPRRSFPSFADFESFQEILKKHLGPKRA